MVVTTASLKMGGTRDLGKSLHLSHLSYLLCKMKILILLRELLHRLNEIMHLKQH